MVGNIVSIMKHAFGYPGTGYVKFHVLVISYQHFDEYRKEILEKIPSFSFIIIKKPNSDFNYFRDFSMVDKNN